MRVLHFYKTSYPDSMGGVEQVICQIARGTQHLGVTTDVLSLSENRAVQGVEVDGYRVHRAHLDFQVASTGFSVSAFAKFSKLASQADLIHYHFPWPFMDLVHFASRVKKKTLVTYHSDIVRQKALLHIYKPLMHKFLRSMDCIVATSPNYLASSNVLAQYASKVQLIPIGLDKATYPKPTAELLAAWRKRLGPKFFLFVGVLRYYKGLHILMEAAKGTNFPIVIVGAGPIEDDLKSQADRLGLANVVFLGSLSEVDKVALLTLCYAVLFPSHLRSEAFGISLLEGAMYGKPLISSEIGTGTTFVNIANETGLVVPPSEPDALRLAMQQLWCDPTMAATLGAAAEARYRKLFEAEQMASAYVGVYARLLSKTPQLEIATTGEISPAQANLL